MPSAFGNALPCSRLQNVPYGLPVWAVLQAETGRFAGRRGRVSWSTVRRRQSKAAAAVAVWGRADMTRLPALAEQT